MMSQTKQAIQRTLVITCGQMADMAGEFLTQQLSQSGQPRAAVAVVAVKRDCDLAQETAVRSALEAVSQTAVRISLAESGWHLDRPGELAICLVVDATAEVSPDWPTAAVTAIQRLVRSVLGIESTALLWVLVPESGDGEQLPILEKLLNASQGMQRGNFVLSVVNEAGLRLADTAVLAQKTAQLLHTLITTALRDAPDWLAEQGGWRQVNAQNTGSAGLALWQWDPEQAQTRLASWWSQSALTGWRQAVIGEEINDECQSRTLLWLDQQTAAPNKLREEISQLVEPFPAPVWAYPQPWQAAKQAEQLKRLAAMLDETAVDAIPLVISALEPSLDRRESALLSACADMLARTPIAGLARCALFSHQLRQEMEQYLDENAARQDNESDRQQGLRALYKQFDQLMTDLLTGLPGEDLGEWVKLLLQPWRWPGMGWRYWQMQTVGQKLAQLVQQMAQLEQQRVVTAVIDSAYNTLLQALCRVEGHVEELADLLRQVQERLVPDGRQAGEPDFYSQLVSSPAVEAAEAATACGGLGVQLLAPDDVGLESALATAGKDRFTAVLSWTAMEALERLLADESAWREWWQTLWQDADPLWRYDAAQLAQGSQGRHSSLVAVAAAGVTDLKERFHGGESSEIRWVETPDSRQIILLRLRAGLVIGS